jgi:hypothetical protein
LLFCSLSSHSRRDTCKCEDCGTQILSCARREGSYPPSGKGEWASRSAGVVFYSQVIHKGGSFSPPCGRRLIFHENSDKIFPVSRGYLFSKESLFCIDAPATLEIAPLRHQRHILRTRSDILRVRVNLRFRGSKTDRHPVRHHRSKSDPPWKFDDRQPLGRLVKARSKHLRDIVWQIA